MSAYQPVLDPACGGRMFWFDKSDSRVLFGDVRDESWELCDGRRFEVKPDMLMDYRDLPFPDETFRMVVLDPPHLRNAGETSYMAPEIRMPRPRDMANRYQDHVQRVFPRPERAWRVDFQME